LLDRLRYKRILQSQIYTSFSYDPTAEPEKKFLKALTKDKRVLPMRLYLNTGLLDALLGLRIEMTFII